MKRPLTVIPGVVLASLAGLYCAAPLTVAERTTTSEAADAAPPFGEADVDAGSGEAGVELGDPPDPPIDGGPDADASDG